MKAILKIEVGGKVYPAEVRLGDSLVVGRSSSATCQVMDDRMSGTHCRFFLRNDRLEIFDLDSKNGTYLNGIRIEQSELFVGDEIKLGGTKISIDEVKTSRDIVEILTFPGPFKDRVHYELRVDFTGARIQNQMFNKHHPASKVEKAAHDREVALRRKAQTGIRVSKQELKTQHPTLKSISFGIDIAVMIGAFLIPLLVIESIIDANGVKLPGFTVTAAQLDDNRNSTMLITELLFLMTVYTLNFKIMKFSVGELSAGLKKIYDRQ